MFGSCNAIVAQELSFYQKELNHGTCVSQGEEEASDVVASPLVDFPRWKEISPRMLSSRASRSENTSRRSTLVENVLENPSLVASTTTLPSSIEGKVPRRSTVPCPEIHSDSISSQEGEEGVSRSPSFLSVSMMFEAFGRSPSQDFLLEEVPENSSLSEVVSIQTKGVVPVEDCHEVLRPPLSTQTKGAAPEEGCSEVIRPPLPAVAFQEEDSHEESSSPFSVRTKGAAQEENRHEVSFSVPQPFSTHLSCEQPLSIPDWVKPQSCHRNFREDMLQQECLRKAATHRGLANLKKKGTLNCIRVPMHWDANMRMHPTCARMSTRAEPSAWAIG